MCKNSDTGKNTKTDKIENIVYKVPNNYDTDIPAEDFMELVLKI